MTFSIIIPTFNNLSEIQGCLTSLGNLGRRDFEVFVCVDGSMDGTNEWLEGTTFDFPVKPLWHEGRGNRGRSAARNLALPFISGDYVLFLDSDMKVGEDCLDQHLEAMAGGGKVSIGTVVYRNANDNLWARYTAGRGVGKFLQGEKVPFNYFITPNTAFPAEWFAGVQGFDEEINRYGGEDLELGYRLGKKYTPVFVNNPAAKVFTLQEKTLDEALGQLKEYGATGLRYIVEKWPELKWIYKVEKLSSGKLKDRIFVALTFKPIRWFGRKIIGLFPYRIKVVLINYLVVSWVFEGYGKPKD